MSTQNHLRWKCFGSSIFTLLLFFILVPAFLAFLLLKFVSGILGLVLVGLTQLLLTLVVKYIYVFRIGALHAWFLKKIQHGNPHSCLTRTDVISSLGYSISIYTIPCLIDNYSYLIVHRGRSLSTSVSQTLQPVKSSPDNENQTINKDNQQGTIDETPNPSPSVSSTLRLEQSIATNTSLHAAIIDACDCGTILKAIDTISKVHYGGKQIKIESILTTHHHHDHQYGNQGLVQQIPGLKVYGGWRDHVDCCTHKVEHGNIIILGDTHHDGIDIEVMETPCHTHGSITYKLPCMGGMDCLFTGDTLFLGGCGAPFEQDRNTM